MIGLRAEQFVRLARRRPPFDGVAKLPAGGWRSPRRDQRCPRRSGFACPNWPWPGCRDRLLTERDLIGVSAGDHRSCPISAGCSGCSGRQTCHERFDLSLGRLTRRLLTASFAAGAVALAVPAHAEIKGLEIIAPANPGGGWDQTARAIQAALQKQTSSPRASRSQNIAGAGGTIGLAQFVTSEEEGRRHPGGRPRSWSAPILTNKSPVTLDQRHAAGAPDRRVRAARGSGRLADQDAWRTCSPSSRPIPGSVSWGGGSRRAAPTTSWRADRQGGRRAMSPR